MTAATWSTRWRAPATERLTRLAGRFWVPAVVFVVSRLVDAVLIVVAARGQLVVTGVDATGHFLTHPPQTSPGYLGVAANWDGQWYERIAEHGYRTRVPMDSSGAVQQNELAFYPLYPMLIRVVMAAGGLPFRTAAVALSILLGLLAVLIMHELLRITSGRRAALFTTLLFCTFMSAPILQIAYTESLGLLLVCAGLLLLHRRQYRWLLPVLLLLALSRPVVAAFAPVILWHGWQRHRCRGRDPFPRRERWAVLTCALTAGLLTGLWPLVTAVMTRTPDAYVRSMRAWGAYARATPGTAWLSYAWQDGRLFGVITLAAVSTGLVAMARWRLARVWGPELQAWAVAYPLYLLTATSPGPSIVRYLLLAFPLVWPFPGWTASRENRSLRLLLVSALAAAGVALQWIWIQHFLVVAVPPGQGVYP